MYILVLVGVTSFGETEENSFGVYTNVYGLLNFIQRHVPDVKLSGCFSPSDYDSGTESELEDLPRFTKENPRIPRGRVLQLDDDDSGTESDLEDLPRFTKENPHIPRGRVLQLDDDDTFSI
eukprot:Pgem_evm1s1421